MSVVEEKESYAASHAHGLGGSDCAAILGMNPWRTPIQVWEAKVHPERVEELDKDCLRWGVLMEPLIRQEYARKFNVEVVAPADLGSLFPNARPWRDSTILTGSHHWMIGMPDGFMPSVQTGLEIKTAARRSDEWGDDGGDEVPVQYLFQVAYYMAITNAPAWNFAVLFSGSDLRQYRIVRDLDLERDIITCCRQFWEDFVAKGIEPPVDQTVDYGVYLARKFSRGSGLVIKDPGPDILSWTAKMKEAEDAEKKATAEKQLANNHLRVLVGDAESAETPLGTIGWVRHEKKDVTNWEAVGKKVGPEHPEVIKEFTKPEQRTNFLRAWWRKSKAAEFGEVEEF